MSMPIPSATAAGATTARHGPTTTAQTTDSTATMTGAATSTLANDAVLLASALQRSSTALASLAVSVSDSLAEAANVSHTASTLVHLGSRSVAAQVASPSGPVSQAADLVARADELGALLADKIISLHEDVRAIHLALDLLESRVSHFASPNFTTNPSM